MNHCRLVDAEVLRSTRDWVIIANVSFNFFFFFFLVERFGSTAAGIPIEYGAPPVRNPWYLSKLEALCLWLGELL
jgi:hypothetical protein